MTIMITSIVFTKNRPLQLEAYLRSRRRFFPEGINKTYIIYKVELFGDEYDQIFAEYPDCTIVRETDFHTDFMEIIRQIDTKYIMFGIDDVVFFDSIDFSVIDNAFDEYADNIFGFTLRFDPESVKGEGDDLEEITVSGQKLYRLNWQKGCTPHTRYPFELCSTIYKLDLVRQIFNGTMSSNEIARALFSPGSVLLSILGKVLSKRKILKSFGFFFSPNTLESWNCRWCQNHGDQLPVYTYFQKLCASAVQVNVVNTSTAGDFAGADEYTVENLNAKFREGYKFDIDYVAGNKPPSLACGREYFRLIKKK